MERKVISQVNSGIPNTKDYVVCFSKGTTPGTAAKIGVTSQLTLQQSTVILHLNVAQVKLVS